MEELLEMRDLRLGRDNCSHLQDQHPHTLKSETLLKKQNQVQEPMHDERKPPMAIKPIGNSKKTEAWIRSAKSRSKPSPNHASTSTHKFQALGNTDDDSSIE